MPRAVKCARSKMGIALLSRNWWEFTYTKIPLSISLSPIRSPVLITEQVTKRERERGGAVMCMTATAETPTRSSRRSRHTSFVTPSTLFSSTSVLNVANPPTPSSSSSLFLVQLVAAADVLRVGSSSDSRLVKSNRPENKMMF